MQELHRLLHNICRWTPLQVAQLPGEKERICCAPPFNMAAEPKWATHGTIAVLVVALLILLPKMTAGNHHHQFDGHGIALDYVDLASPYVMDEPNSASETSSRRDLKWEAEEAEDLAGFGEMESAYSEALVVYEDYMETIFESCGCAWNSSAAVWDGLEPSTGGLEPLLRGFGTLR